MRYTPQPVRRVLPGMQGTWRWQPHHLERVHAGVSPALYFEEDQYDGSAEGAFLLRGLEIQGRTQELNTHIGDVVRRLQRLGRMLPRLSTTSGAA